jgi:hypothetical protein
LHCPSRATVFEETAERPGNRHDDASESGKRCCPALESFRDCDFFVNELRRNLDQRFDSLARQWEDEAMGGRMERRPDMSQTLY